MSSRASIAGRVSVAMLSAALALAVHAHAWAVPMTLEPVGLTTGPGGGGAAAVSPDGRHVYNAGSAVTVFARDLGTGALTFVENEPLSVGFPPSIVISADGAHVYAGSGEYPYGIACFARDPGTGALSIIEVVSGLGSAMALSPDGAYLYTGWHNRIEVWARDPVAGTLTFVESEFGFPQFSFYSVQDLAVSPDGAHLYAADRDRSALVVFSRDAVTGTLAVAQVVFDNVGGVDGLYGTRSVTVSPDGAHVYATGTFDDAVAAFARHPVTGALTFIEVERDGVGGVDGLTGVLDVLVSPDGSHVYVASGADGAVTSFSRNVGTGALAFLEAEHDGGVEGAQRLAVSPDGTSLYVGATGTLAALARDAATGSLTSVQAVGRLGHGGTAISPDGLHAYMTGSGPNGAVLALSRDVGSGLLTYVDTAIDGAAGVDGLDGAADVVVSPDGAHVYVAAHDEDAVPLFTRDAGTGRLAFVSAVRDGVGGVDGLDGATALAFGAGGPHLYAASDVDDAVAVFSRSPVTGALTLVEVERDGVAGVNGLDGASDVIVSPDGAHVYVAGTAEAAIATFGRDTGSGALTFLGAVSSSAVALAISADGAQVYASTSGQLTVFGRDAVTGALTTLQVARHLEAGVDGLYFGTDVVASPDGTHVYLAAGAVFARIPPGDELRFVHRASPPQFGGPITVSPDARHVYRGPEVWSPAFAGCDAVPLASCRTAGRSTIRLATLGRLVSWRWALGAATDLADLGDPVTSTHYALCLYDESTPPPASIAYRALAPAGGLRLGNRPVWKAFGSGFTFKDDYKTPEGLFTMRLKSGTAGKARITVKASPKSAEMPPLPTGLPLRVQLQSSTGECWEAVFPIATQNTATSVRATQN
jgi:6-phosphogluconolactonase (cycloisomerase 2 family)